MEVQLTAVSQWLKCFECKISRHLFCGVPVGVEGCSSLADFYIEFIQRITLSLITLKENGRMGSRKLLISTSNTQYN